MKTTVPTFKLDKPFNVTVILGSTRIGRMAPMVGNRIVPRFAARGHNVQLIDPVDEKFKLPLMEKPFHHYKNPKEAPENVQRIANIFDQTYGFVWIASEYNHSIPPALINTLDHFYLNQYKWKTVGLVTYSAQGTGGARTQYQLRNVAGELGMITVPFAPGIPNIFQAFKEDGTLKDDKLEGRLDYFVSEFEYYVQAMIKAKNLGIPTGFV